MKKILLAFLLLIFASSVCAQITIFEYKDEDKKAYCTFELDRELTADSTQIRGLLRAYEYLGVHYFDMVFYARAYLTADSITTLSVKPYFYNHANVADLMGESERMKGHTLTFQLAGDELTHTTSDEDMEALMFQSTFSKKNLMRLSEIPKTYTRATRIDWKYITGKLRKNLQEKDKTFWRKYK